MTVRAGELSLATRDDLVGGSGKQEGRIASSSARLGSKLTP